MAQYSIDTDVIRDYIPELCAGDRVLLSGTVYTARDAAHKRIFELLDSGADLPFDLNKAIIYYAGPTPAREGMAVGSCGPTTSGRMNPFAPRLLDLGLPAIIGKGSMNNQVKTALVRNKAVYFCAVGGAGALIARCVMDSEEVAFSDLGCESIKRLTVEKLPVTVALDCKGGDLYVSGRKKFCI